jgi:hypothetical protein
MARGTCDKMTRVDRGRQVRFIRIMEE